MTFQTDHEHQSTEQDTVKKWTGFHVLAVMVLFFSVIIAVNLYMAVVASTTWSGLQAKNGYVASQEFNANRQVAVKHEIRGWHSKVAYQAGTFSVTILDADQQLQTMSGVKVHIGRPVSQQFDQTQSLALQSTGDWQTAINLTSGIWQIEIDGATPGEFYRRRLQLLVDEDGIGTVQ